MERKKSFLKNNRDYNKNNKNSNTSATSAVFGFKKSKFNILTSSIVKRHSYYMRTSEVKRYK